MYKKIICMVILLISICSCASIANAAITASDYINGYNAHINNDTSKTIEVVFTVTSPDYMDLLGAKTIILQEKATGSTKWDPVETYNYKTDPAMLKENARTYDYSVFYYDAVPGYSYRAKVYFYAEKGGSDTIEYITPAKTAK